ncbi:diacylglycerol kinase [Parafrigoribacterium mesophilum]|uniref:diacylglycerol kinase family protein n=1 Tax=Parafrigoribacterium mesophilum TaxID=433646 RepID=UPI0031FCA2B2
MTTTETLHIVVAVNPEACFGKSRTVGPMVIAELRAAGHDVVALTEPDYLHLVAAVEAAIIPKPDALVVVGGDGMVGLAANALAGTGIPLGIVPSGSGNDMARGLGIPLRDPAAAVAALLEAIRRPPRVVDAATVVREGKERMWFAGVLSAGFDAIVNERANRMRWPRGRSRYNLALLLELAVLKPIRYRLVLDGVDTVTDALLVAVANNTSFGGGMLITPEARLDDGLLDVFVVQPMSRIAFLRIFPRVFAGTHVTDPRVSIHRASRILIEAAGVVAYADGERVSALPVEVEVVPGALRVLAPAPKPRRLVSPAAVWHTR